MPSRKKWKGLFKSAEECAELTVELMKLNSYPDGKHPRRRRSVVLTVEEEIADVFASLNYLIDKNGLDRARIDKREAAKYHKYARRWGDTKRTKKKVSKKATNRAAKKRTVGQIAIVDASSIVAQVK